MALITCKDCGSQFSTDAKKCIHCGAKKPINKTEVAITILGAIIFIAIFYTSDKGTAVDPSCSSDWRLCISNEDLVNNYKKYTDVEIDCKRAAQNAAKYGEPEFSWSPFSNFHPGNDYPKTGIVFAYDFTAKFQNAYGTRVKSRAVCIYDLNQNKVTSIDIRED